MSDLRPLSGDSTSRSGRLDRILADLVSHAPEIEATAVVSFDGLPMVSALPPGMDEDRVAAMSAALLSLGERAAEGLGRGELSQVYIEGESGTVFLVSCDNEAVLVAVAAAGAKAGLMLYEVRRAAASIAAVLCEDEPVVPAPPVLPMPPAVAAPVMPVPTMPVPTMPVPAAPPVQPAPPASYVPPAASVEPPFPVPAADAEPPAPTFQPLHAGSLEPAPHSVNGSGGHGWSSYAPNNGLPGEPTPWS